MKDEQCVAFLQWMLPKLGFRWNGFRKVRNQVCKRITRRFQDLGVRSIDEYKQYLNDHKEEWDVLYSFCYATVSKFYRDKRVYDILGNALLPGLAEKYQDTDEKVRIWSAGSCSGEEPYTISILWKIRVAEQFESLPDLEIIATDFKQTLIARAEEGDYPESSLQDLPEELAEIAFNQQNGHYKLKDEFKNPVTFQRQDIRQQLPGGPFSIILCRNLVFTYFTADIQTKLLKQMLSKLRPAGYFIIGEHEALPDETGLKQHPESPCIFQKDRAGTSES